MRSSSSAPSSSTACRPDSAACSSAIVAPGTPARASLAREPAGAAEALARNASCGLPFHDSRRAVRADLDPRHCLRPAHARPQRDRAQLAARHHQRLHGSQDPLQLLRVDGGLAREPAHCGHLSLACAGLLLDASSWHAIPAVLATATHPCG